MKPILVVQHAGDCPPALVGDWLVDAGARTAVVRPYAGDELPVPDGLTDFSGLLVLGGPMGALDDDCPWLTPVKRLVGAAGRIDLPTLGICLGHQLIAVALGGAVATNPRGQQLGVLDVGWTAAAATDELFGPLAGEARGVQWNDDIVAQLPEDAVLLAATLHGEVQAARYAPRTWGVQLHPEVDVAVVAAWAASDAGSHESQGIDQAALLADIEGAQAELDDTWRPLASGFARLCSAHHVPAR